MKENTDEKSLLKVNENFEEKKIKIKVDDLKNGFPAPVCLPNTKPLNLNIKSEKKEIIPINKL